MYVLLTHIYIFSIKFFIQYCTEYTNTFYGTYPTLLYTTTKTENNYETYSNNMQTFLSKCNHTLKLLKIL